MTTAIPTPQELDALHTRLRKAQADAAAKQKVAPRTYSLQAVNTTQLQRDLAKLDGLLGEVLVLAKGKPDFAKKHAQQLAAVGKLKQGAQDLAGNPTLLPFLDVLLRPILMAALPLVDALKQAAKAFVPTPVRSINDQVSDLLKQLFSGGDLGPNSPAAKHAVTVDLPARGKTVDALRAYLLANNGAAKAWYRVKFALR